MQIIKELVSATSAEPIHIPVSDGMLYPSNEAAKKLRKHLPETSSLSLTIIPDETDGKPLGVAIGFVGVCDAVIDFNEVVMLTNWLREAMQTKGGAPC